MTLGANTTGQNIRVKLFIEGVSVPFNQITVSSTKMDMPTATISIPPLPGMNEIARYYQPKVHIFYRDLDYVGSKEEESKEHWKLLFHGIIASTGYHRSSGLGASAGLSFQCIHKNSLAYGVTLQYHGRGPESLNGGAIDATASPLTFNSQDSVLQALKGVKKDTKTLDRDNFKHDDATTSLLPSMISNPDGYYRRIRGMPGVLLNYWNQLKRDTYVMEDDGAVYPESMLDMYIPLVERGTTNYGDGQGLRFFDRLSGHPSLETPVDLDRSAITDLGQDEEGRGGLQSEVDTTDLITPPSLKDTISDAAGAHLATVITSMAQGFSTESATFAGMLNVMASTFDYSLLTLTSPSKLNDGLPAVETIFRPVMDTYYAPKCNLITQNMYDSIQVSENIHGLPTRLISAQHLAVDSQGIPLRYRSPQSVREAIAEDGDLTTTLLTSKDKVGTYEWGRGIVAQHTDLPPWLQYLYSGINHEEVTEGSPSKHAEDMVKVFRAQYGQLYRNNLIPWSSASGLNQYQRILVASMDHRFATHMAGARSGSMSGAFNPYAVAGYPMDILGPDNTTPSYHAMCTAITHTITDASINTSYGLDGCMTYEELYSYYLPPVSPWLAANLGFTNSVSIVDNPTALAKACEFYAGVLGVGAVGPENVHDFTTGRPKAIRNQGRAAPFVPEPAGFESRPSSYVELNPNRSVQGALNLVRREIESMADYEETFGIHFIDVERQPANQSYINEDVGIADITHGKLEPGRSPMLDYPDNPWAFTEAPYIPPVTSDIEGAPQAGPPKSFRDGII